MPDMMNVREWALPVYTVLLQLAVGGYFVLWSIRSFILKDWDLATVDRVFRKPVLALFVTIVVAIIGSHFHLSRPYFSFLAVLNFRTSWLSREIIFTILLLLSSGVLTVLVWFRPTRTGLKTALGWAVIAFGGASIFCMSSIYILPVQPSWNTPATILLFFGTALLLGVTSVAALLIMDTVLSDTQEPELASMRHGILQRSFTWFAALAGGVMLVIIMLNGFQILLMQNGDDLLQTSLSLLFDPYGPLFSVRFLALLAGVIVLETSVIGILWKRKPLVAIVAPVYLACLLIIISEILGRFLFYAIHIRVGV